MTTQLSPLRYTNFQATKLSLTQHRFYPHRQPLPLSVQDWTPFQVLQKKEYSPAGDTMT